MCAYYSFSLTRNTVRKYAQTNLLRFSHSKTIIDTAVKFSEIFYRQQRDKTAEFLTKSFVDTKNDYRRNRYFDTERSTSIYFSKLHK